MPVLTPRKTRYNHTSARTCAHFVVATSFVLPLLRALSVTPRVSCCDDGRTSWRAMRRPNQSWLFCSARLLSRSWTSSLQIPSPFVGQLTKIATVHVTRVPRTRFVVGRYMKCSGMRQITIEFNTIMHRIHNLNVHVSRNTSILSSFTTILIARSLLLHDSVVEIKPGIRPYACSVSRHVPRLTGQNARFSMISIMLASA
jgi:hypothetical protein